METTHFEGGGVETTEMIIDAPPTRTIAEKFGLRAQPGPEPPNQLLSHPLD